MESFFTFLRRRAQDTSSLLCVGLDPHPQDLSEPTAQAALEFSLRLVEQTHPYAAAYKPNAAFFEQYGPDGWAALKTLIDTIYEIGYSRGSRIPVVLDAKRGDIASTARAYARSALEVLKADCITLSPYLGRDSVAPFIANHEKGVFLLCKTSNPSASDLQDLPVGLMGQTTLYEYVAHLAQSWNEKDNIGLVVGATQVEALARVREAAPDLWMLTPGVGAQGGDLEQAMAAGLRADGLGMLIPVSRGIARADSPKRAAAELRDAIAQTAFGRVHKAAVPAKLSNTQKALADDLLAIGCVRFGEFTLKSGLVSPIYLDLRRLAAAPKVLAKVAHAMLPLLHQLDFAHVAPLPYAALPIGTAVCLQGNYSMIYPRKEVKQYGTKAQIEGVFEAGDRAVVLDDLITTGGSKIEGIGKLVDGGLVVEDVVVLIDRDSGGRELMAENGYRLHSVLTLPDMLDYWENANKVPAAQIAAVRTFLAEN